MMLTVVFQVREERYGIRSQSILEVIPLVRLRPVPRAPSWLIGMFVYRGTLTPVIDLCMLIGGYVCPARLSSRIILVHGTLPDGSMQVVGFEAERVTEARKVNPTQSSSGALSVTRRFGDVVLEGGSLLHLVEVDALIAEIASISSELKPLKELSNGETDR